MNTLMRQENFLKLVYLSNIYNLVYQQLFGTLKVNNKVTYFSQESAHFIISLSPLLFPLISSLFLFNWYTLPFVLAYYTFIIFDKSPERGGYTLDSVKNSLFWKHYADYYSSKLIKEVDLDPKKNYLFAYHPHGLIALGSLTNFATNATGFNNKFPGIDLSVATLGLNFYLPLYREFLLTTGLIGSSRKSISHKLQMGPGHSCMVVVGGAKEALLSNPGKADLFLANRFGFVKMAIINGAELVPVYCFGENHMYKIFSPDPSTWFGTLQILVKQHLGFYFPKFKGRSPFTEKSGFMPRRIPLVAVVGEPIAIIKDENPSEEKIREIHTEYMRRLKDLYNRYKHKYHPEKSYPVPDIIFH